MDRDMGKTDPKSLSNYRRLSLKENNLNANNLETTVEFTFIKNEGPGEILCIMSANIFQDFYNFLFPTDVFILVSSHFITQLRKSSTIFSF